MVGGNQWSSGSLPMRMTIGLSTRRGRRALNYRNPFGRAGWRNDRRRLWLVHNHLYKSSDSILYWARSSESFVKKASMMFWSRDVSRLISMVLPRAVDSSGWCWRNLVVQFLPRGLWSSFSSSMQPTICCIVVWFKGRIWRCRSSSQCTRTFSWAGVGRRKEL